MTTPLVSTIKAYAVPVILLTLLVACSTSSPTFTPSPTRTSALTLPSPPTLTSTPTPDVVLLETELNQFIAHELCSRHNLASDLLVSRVQHITAPEDSCQSTAGHVQNAWQCQKNNPVAVDGPTFSTAASLASRPVGVCEDHPVSVGFFALDVVANTEATATTFVRHPVQRQYEIWHLIKVDGQWEVESTDQLCFIYYEQYCMTVTVVP